MSLAGIWTLIRMVLGKLTDLLTAGRAQGWWDKGGGPPQDGPQP